ncbi:M1 family metallopeptidase [Oleiagrimonas sp. C23AA]|uniref:M1 family metallopeptidase n=1 Tax=Oleiagrimonas sp. C23AA TaxID=2719047 RepID=UPI00141DD59E|nr:M1 family metallopeptidase [Oleiagrimonas sp. C23AA]NII09992.1 M1 family metallopeptidase [Oleiagrimonas sp. C23AA]
MHRMIRPLVLTALAACCSASFAATDHAPLEKLPRWAVPEGYSLALRIDPTRASYSGSTVIKVDLKKATDHIWLHGKELKVSKVSFTTADGKVHAAKYVNAAPKEGVVRVDLGQTVKPQTLTLTFAFSAPFNQQLQGLYKVTHAGRPYTMTQMEPVSARYAFPSFDEPDFKTPYSISLTIPDDEVGVANTKQVSKVENGHGWKTLTFAPTKPLPTYLVAFAVGPWDVVDGPTIPADKYRSEPIRLRGIAAKGEGPRMKRSLAQTPKIIQTLENYYGFGYPFGKLDLLAAPDFSAGAMENAGLVTFRDWYLLLDKDSSPRYVQGSFNVQAHELAHQWTGDTVTMAWWNDLWLNESFATWMQQKVAMKLHPSYRTDLDRITGAQHAMSNDSLVSARKIRQPITGNGDIETAFDGITYQKGAAVLGMFEGYVGDKTFQKGMRAYIQQHKFGNATADDLVDAIAEAAGKGKTFKHAFNSFLDQSGVPVVETKLDCSGHKAVLHLKQSRYLPLGSKGSPDRTWGVPVCVRTGAGKNAVQCDLLSAATGSMTLATGGSCPAFYMPNAEARGYYRFAMDRADLAKLTAHVKQLDDREQLAYADAIDAGFHRGDLNAADALAAMKQLASSSQRKVALAPLDTVGWIWRHEATTPAQRKVLADAVSAAYLPRLEKLGYQRRDGESADDALMRGSLAGFLGLQIKVPSVRQHLLSLGEKALERTHDGHLNLDAVNPDLLASALGVAAQEKGKPVVMALETEIGRATDPSKRNAMLSALADVHDVALTDRIRDFALGKQVKVGEMAMVLRGGRDTPAERDAAWTWFTGHYDQIVKRTGTFATGYLPNLFGGGGCSLAEANRLEAYFKPKLADLSGADRGLAQTTESIHLCAALKAKQGGFDLTH